MPLPTKQVIEDALHRFLDIFLSSQQKQDEESLSDLSIDPIPMLLHCSLTGFQSKTDLLRAENWRRLDKAFSNEIGGFHETLLNSIEGWHKPETGFDLRNDDLKIAVEIKNKHNTMNSSSQKATFDKCLYFVQANPDWTVYLSTIVPKKGRIEKPWKVPNRTENPKINIIDGATLYAKVCGVEDALAQVYQQLPSIMAEKNYAPSAEGQAWFHALYAKLYQ